LSGRSQARDAREGQSEVGNDRLTNGQAAAQKRSPGAWLRARARRLRPWHAVPIALGLALFVAISLLLARFLATENAERDAILAVLRAQAAGDARAMLSKLDGCAAKQSCAAVVRADAASLRRHGAVKILLLNSKTAYSLGGSTGKTRVAWTVIGQLSVVQCVQVRRTGSFLTGMSVKLLSISARIPGESGC
jgi:hypothetical protein